MSQTKKQMEQIIADLKNELDLTQRRLVAQERELTKQTAVSDACTKAMEELHRAADALMIQTAITAGRQDGNAGYTLKLPTPDVKKLLSQYKVHVLRQDGSYAVSAVPVGGKANG